MISSEDFLSNLHRLNGTLRTEKFQLYNPECVEHVSGANRDTVIMVATDVVALFPSLGIDETARICGQVAEASNLEIDNVDYTEMLLYLRLNEDKAGDLGFLVNFLPTRKSKGGGGPTMRSEQIKGPWHQEDIEKEKLQWIHKPPPRNVRIRRKILGKDIEVGDKLMFTMFAYTFGGKIYRQLD